MAFKCDNCGYTSPKWFGLCPKCKNGTGEEYKEETNGTSSGISGSNVWDSGIPKWEGAPISQRARKVTTDEKEDVIIFKTQYPGLNAILSSGKGFVESQVCLLGASPGVGKSTLCISIANEDTLYISSEENFKQVNSRALRVNPNSDCLILNTTNISDILDAIQNCEQKLVIIDSLNGIEFGVGYTTVARFANEITKIIKETNKCCIIISQVNRDGEITGMNSVVHIVDTVLHLERSETSSNIIAVSSKNRFGEIGSVAIFRHLQNGFEEIEAETDISEPEIGSTETETRFGHKLMSITIEALVADSQAAFGLRKSNGYNTNRLIQLIGILSYFGHIDLLKKDIYVAVSNGLYTDDISIELAMANSILSCYFGKAIVKSAYGEIRLNGKIINGTVDGEEIKHIKELISLYKSSKE